MQVGTQSGDLGRMAALDAGYDITASGVTLDRFCGSGITTANMAVASVMAGMEDVVIAGGTEMMSSYKENASKARLPFMRSEEHTSELQSLMRISYAVFCLKKKQNLPSTPSDKNNTHN